MPASPRFARRPSPAVVLASAALFVALGGPAMAGDLVNGRSIKAGTVSGKQVKDFSIGERELNKKLIASLLAVPAGSVNAGSIADGSLTGAELAPDSISGTLLAPGTVDGTRLSANSVGGGTVADGSLGAADLAPGSVETGSVQNGVLRGEDVGRFGGELNLSFASIENGKCGTSTSTSLSPIAGASQDLNDDVIVVTPPSGFPAGVSVTARPASANQITVVPCNLSGGTVNLGSVKFHYLTIDSVGP